MTQEMETAELKELSNLAHSLDESGYLPKRHIVGSVGPPAAKLVVKSDRSLIRQSFARFQVVMGGARPTM